MITFDKYYFLSNYFALLNEKGLINLYSGDIKFLKIKPQQ